MPLMKGNSKEVVGSNIREMMKSGRSRNESIAASLSSARKYKKMADGGMVEDDDQDEPEVPMYAEGGMVDTDPEDYNRSMTELQLEARSYPNEVANPETHEQDAEFAKALRRKAQMEMGAEGSNFADGGLVEPEHLSDMGNKPMEEDMEADTAEPLSTMPGRGQGTEDKMDRMPSGPELSEDAKKALMERKMRRRFK